MHAISTQGVTLSQLQLPSLNSPEGQSQGAVSGKSARVVASAIKRSAQPTRQTGEADEEWMRNAFDGDLWQYVEVRCETTASLFGAVQELCNEYGAAFMPFGNEAGRQVARGIDFSLIRPHLKRVSLAAPGATPEEKRAGLKAGVAAVPEYAVPEIMHNQRSFDSAEALCAAVGMARDAGIRHHSFHCYGMSRRHELEWIGHARDAWA